MKLGEPDYAFEMDEVDLIVGRMWLQAKPGALLVNSWNNLIVRGSAEHRVETALTRLTSNTEEAKLARDCEFVEWLRPWLEWHAGFVALRRHFAAIGIKGDYRGFGEYVGQAELYSFVVRKEHLPAIERLAQDEAGFVNDAQRASAAADFRTYMLRHYDPDWEANRVRLPVVDVSPYAMPPFAEPSRV